MSIIFYNYLSRIFLILALFNSIQANDKSFSKDEATGPYTSLPSSSRTGKEIRIGIIGAGAAGISAAYYLKKNGYTDVTILEKENRVGGKCHSVTIGANTYELGAILVPKFYENIRDLGITLHQGLENVPPSYEMSPLGKSTSSLPYTWKEIIKGVILRLKNAIAFKYTMPKTGFFGVSQSKVSDNSAQFLEENKLSIWQRYWKFSVESCGYGPLKTTAAAYALRMFPPKAVSVLTLGKVLPSQQFGSCFTSGYQSLFKEMAKNLTVHTQHTVEWIDYNQLGIEVKTQHFSKGTVSFQFDKLIVAIPPDHLIGKTDLSENEKSLFSKIRYYDYGVTLFEPQQPLTYKAFLNEQICEHAPVMLVQNWPASPVVTSYAYGDLEEHAHGEINTDGKAVTSALDNRVQELFGTNVKKIHAQKHWEYFPHISSQDIKDGWFDQMEAMQGAKNTYYVGSALSFELVETVVAYSKELVNKHFPANPTSRGWFSSAWARAFGKH